MMKCAICGIRIDSIDKVIEEGWVPYFYEGDKEHDPVCPSCSEKRNSMCLNQIGEL